MSYEEAPATQMLATHCCVCGRPLVDAISVETGIGPVCRRRYLPEGFSEEDRSAANKLVYQASLIFQAARTDREAAAKVAGIVSAIRALGSSFDALADRVAETAIRPKIELEQREVTFGKGQYAQVVPALVVKVPYDPCFNAAFKAAVDWRDRTPVIEGGEFKAWAVKATYQAKSALLAVLKERFAGEAARGPKGIFFLETSEAHA
jgi:uncharacterized Zn finger protein (UPF0148 family)